MKDLNSILGLSNQIRNIIRELYCMEFTNNIEVVKDKDLYTAKLYIHHPFYAPMIISKQSNSDENFLRYVYNTLKDNDLRMSSHLKLNKI